MASERDQSLAFKIAIFITIACVSTPIILGAIGFYQKLPLGASLAILFADLSTVALVWILFARGKLGPKK